MNKHLKTIGFLIISAAVLMAFLSVGYVELVPREVTITIQQKKWSILDASEGSSPMLSGANNWIQDSNGIWYENNVNFGRLKWSAAAIDQALEVGGMYRVKIKGLNVPFMRQFPLIVEVVEAVEGREADGH